MSVQRNLSNEVMLSLRRPANLSGWNVGGFSAYPDGVCCVCENLSGRIVVRPVGAVRPRAWYVPSELKFCLTKIV